MAFAKKAKQEPVEEKSGQPDYVARARQSADSSYYVTIGAAWKKTGEKGEFISVKINSQPVGWDGSFLLMKPLEPRE